MAKINFIPAEIPSPAPQAAPVEASAPQGYTPTFNAEKASHMSAMIRAITNFDSSALETETEKNTSEDEILKKFEKLMKVFKKESN